MSKPRSNSIIDGLPANQRETLTTWLFEENVSYKDAAARLWQDFSVRCSARAVGEFYQRAAQLRMLDRIAASRTQANQVVDAFKKNPADMYAALVDMVGQIAFETSLKGGEEFDPKVMFNFTKLVMHARKQDLEAQGLSLARDKFQFDAAKAALKCLPGLRKIAANNALNETDRLTQARQLLFGELPEDKA